MSYSSGTITFIGDIADGDSIRVVAGGIDTTFEFDQAGNGVAEGNVALVSAGDAGDAASTLDFGLNQFFEEVLNIALDGASITLTPKTGAEFTALSDSDDTDTRITTETMEEPEEPMPETATYDPALPTLKDSIRLALGDTDMTEPLLLDATILAKLGLFPYNEALAQLAEALIAEFGQKPDEYSEDRGIRLKWTQRMNAWQRVIDAARSGQIMAPTATRTSRAAGAVGQLNTPSMTGFRSD